MVQFWDLLPWAALRGGFAAHPIAVRLLLLFVATESVRSAVRAALFQPALLPFWTRGVTPHRAAMLAMPTVFLALFPYAAVGLLGPAGPAEMLLVCLLGAPLAVRRGWAAALLAVSGVVHPAVAVVVALVFGPKMVGEALFSPEGMGRNLVFRPHPAARARPPSPGGRRGREGVEAALSGKEGVQAASSGREGIEAASSGSAVVAWRPQNAALLALLHRDLLCLWRLERPALAGLLLLALPGAALLLGLRKNGGLDPAALSVAAGVLLLVASPAAAEVLGRLRAHLGSAFFRPEWPLSASRRVASLFLLAAGALFPTSAALAATGQLAPAGVASLGITLLGAVAGMVLFASLSQRRPFNFGLYLFWAFTLLGLVIARLPLLVAALSAGALAVATRLLDRHWNRS